MEKTKTNRAKSRKAMKSHLKMTREPRETEAEAEEGDVDLQGKSNVKKHTNTSHEGDGDFTTEVDSIEANKD